MSRTVVRILVTGARSITDVQAETVRVVLSGTWVELDAKFHNAGAITPELVIVQGECPSGGVDAVAARWAAVRHDLGVRTEGHPAEVAANGRFLGPERNSRMVALGADVCLAFPGERSRGTWDCLTKAGKAGIPVRIYPLFPAKAGR